MLILDKGTDTERSLRVILESDEFGLEYFDLAETVDELKALYCRVLDEVVQKNDGVERVVGIAVIPKGCYGDGDSYGHDLVNETISRLPMTGTASDGKKLEVEHAQSTKSQAKPEKCDMLFGEVGWTVNDVVTLFDISEDCAYDWLVARERHIRHRIVDVGRSVLKELGRRDGLKLRDYQD